MGKSKEKEKQVDKKTAKKADKGGKTKEKKKRKSSSSSSQSSSADEDGHVALTNAIGQAFGLILDQFKVIHHIYCQGITFCIGLVCNWIVGGANWGLSVGFFQAIHERESRSNIPLGGLSWPRKPKNLILNKSVSKVNDIKPFVLATCVARLHPCITELSLMRLGGELTELRRKHLQDFKPSDQSESLQLRLSLAQSLANAEKAWRGRLVQILTKGLLVVGNKQQPSVVDWWIIIVHSFLTLQV